MNPKQNKKKNFIFFSIHIVNIQQHQKEVEKLSFPPPHFPYTQCKISISINFPSTFFFIFFIYTHVNLISSHFYFTCHTSHISYFLHHRTFFFTHQILPRIFFYILHIYEHILTISFFCSLYVVCFLNENEEKKNPSTPRNSAQMK